MNHIPRNLDARSNMDSPVPIATHTHTHIYIYIYMFAYMFVIEEGESCHINSFEEVGIMR